MKTKKSARKYAASGKLKKDIQARHKHQQIKRRIEGRKGRTANGKGSKPTFNGKEKTPKGHRNTIREGEDEENDNEEDVEMEFEERKGKVSKQKKQKKKTDQQESEDGFLSETGESGSEDDSEDGSDSEGEDDASFGSLDDFDETDDAGANHLAELSKLAEKDPEFYKYLQENDKELLEFDLDGDQGEGASDISDDEMVTGIPDEDEEQDEDEETVPALTMDELRKWQKALLEQYSLRALRKLLVAFRAAAYANDETANVSWTIDDPSVFDKLVTTSLKYTPVVLDHHIPYKTLPNGKLKPPLQSPKQQTLTRLIVTFFNSIMHLLSQLTDSRMIITCLTESSKLVPYIIGHRKAVKSYLKACFGMWSAPNVGTVADKAEDEIEDEDDTDKVRIAAFLSVRKVAMGSDESLLDMVLKGSYTTLLRSSKATDAHSLPGLNLMKNTAVELYLLDQATSYQHAFGYIRQLAVTLRNTLKVRPGAPKDSANTDGKDKSKKNTKEPYQQVYNWQFVHCVDFWSMLLNRACEKDQVDSELKPLVYPLVQVTLGAVKLVPTPRYYPLHLHLLRSLLALSHHTGVYIPIPAYLMPILSALLSVQKPKSSTLKPLDLDLNIRASTAYLKTRIYGDEVIDETIYLLAEWCADLQDSVAFPEIVVPVITGLKRCLKLTKSNKSGNGEKGKKLADGKSAKAIKTLIERLEEGVTWVKEKRLNVKFAPGDRDEVNKWERNIKKAETPVGKYANVLKKARERKKKMLDMARQGQEEYLDE